MEREAIYTGKDRKVDDIFGAVSIPDGPAASPGQETSRAARDSAAFFAEKRSEAEGGGDGSADLRRGRGRTTKRMTTENFVTLSFF